MRKSYIDYKWMKKKMNACFEPLSVFVYNFRELFGEVNGQSIKRLHDDEEEEGEGPLVKKGPVSTTKPTDFLTSVSMGDRISACIIHQLYF